MSGNRLGHPPDDAVTLVLGSGGRRYREYLLAGASAPGPVWLLEAGEPTWQRAYAEGASVVKLLDDERLVPDVEALVDAAVEVAEERGVRGVITWDETLVGATAHVAQRLGLPGLTVAGAESCRDKQRTRRLLTDAGINQPRFAYVASADEARAAADSFGYPVVVKPRGMGGSIGVIRVTAADQIGEAFHVAESASMAGNPRYEGGALVEEFLVGPEISVDGAVYKGEYRPVFVAHKRTGLSPYFEEIGHSVQSGDPLLADTELTGMLAEAHRVLGVQYGMTHTELMCTGRGPVIVEVNGRLGGDLIPYLGRLATGIDPALLAVDLARGIRPEIFPSRGSCSAIRFLYPPADGRVAAVELPVPGTGGVVDAQPLVDPGALLLLPPRGYMSRYGYVITEGPTPTECEARLDEAVALASITMDPE